MLEPCLTGFRTACQAHRECIEPREPPLEMYAPAWALTEASPRAFAWLKGFYAGWNFMAEHKGWPEWTYARMVYKRITQEDGGGDDGAARPGE